MLRPGPLEMGLILVIIIVVAVPVALLVSRSSRNRAQDEQLYLIEGKMYCRNCGKELVGNPEFCMNCGARPLAGTSFCLACGGATNPLSEICVKCGARVAKVGIVSPKSRLATVLLAWFLGEFGAHRFYVGKTGTAVVMLILGIVGWATVWFLVGLIFLIPVGIWAFIDFIIAIVGNMKDKEGRLIEKW